MPAFRGQECTRHTILASFWLFVFSLLISSLLISPAPAFGQNPPEPTDTTQQPTHPSEKENPEQENKNEGSNPAAAVVKKTGKVTVKAAEATVHMTETAMLKARDWESNWVTGVFVEKGHTMTPLTSAQRRELYLDQTMTTPGAYLKRMFGAGIDQARGVPPEWQGGFGGYGERIASREGLFITENSLTALGNAALRYEPRYDQCQCKGFWPRTQHAVIRNFLTYDRTERRLRPQFALYGGSFGGGMVSTAWKPKPRNAFAEGGREMLSQAGWGALLNFFIEFAGDINRKLGARRSDVPKL